MAQAAHVAHAIDVDAIERFSLKLFIAEGRVVRPRQIIDIFHDWIRERAVPGLLIDVADYGHLPESPNVLLVAHEANYVFDCHRRAGFAYTVKRKTPGSLAGRIADAASTLFFAARRLQQDTADDPDGAIPFQVDRIELVINDRLHGPKTPAVEWALRGAVEQAARLIFGETRVESTPLADDDRTGVTLRIPNAPALETLV